MSRAPFMPLWVADFLADTMDLDASEIGAYMLLLMSQWQRDGRSLPDDTKKLQRIARCGRNWPKVWASIDRYFDRDESGVYSKRLRFEAQNVAAKREVNAQNGARGGKAKALKSNNADLADATISPERKPSIPEPEPYRDDDGGGSASAREQSSEQMRAPQTAQPTWREQLLAAMGVDRSGLTGNGALTLGTEADMLEARRWVTDLKISPAEAIRVVSEVMARKRDGMPPNTFRFFTKAMQRFASDKAAASAPLSPAAASATRPANSQPDVAAIMAKLEAQGRVR